MGRSVIVEHRVPARYLGPVMPGSDSNPSGPRARQRWLLLGWTPALYNDTVPVLLTPGQIVEVT